MKLSLDQRWAELAPLLDELLPMPPQARAAWLASQPIDDDLRELARRLAEADSRAGDALEASCDTERDIPLEEPSSFVAPEIAGYRVIRFVGAGGMASVFLAERRLADTVQAVALKLLRLNVHNPEERRLFRREQAALARLEHRNIARLIDAGFAADGTPWLAVEYVEGESLLAWCDSRCVDLRQRAIVFLEICQAVSAAHQALIVHRDLKPANVLVRTDGTVKLVDFGIAKLLEADGDATRTEMRRLTPGYAAPEQFHGDAVGTGADIYALGVILTELMTGTRPEPHADGSVARLSTQRIDLACAQARGTDVASLRRLVRGDLEAIVGRALRPDPRQRYASVEALAADVDAWLQNRPVAARRGTRRYRLGCFLRRHTMALAASTIAVVALLAATGISLRLAQRADQAAALAREEAQRARRVQDFVVGMFRVGENGIPKGRATSAEELVDRALAVARREFRNQPESLVPLLGALGELHRGLGHLDTSLAVLAEAADIGQSRLGAGDSRTLGAEAELAHTRFRAGDYGPAAERLRAAMARYHTAGGAPSEAVSAALGRLGMLELQLDEPGTALAHLAESVEIGRRVFAGDHPALQRTIEVYGGALADAGQPAHAAAVLGENLAMARRLYGNDHIVVASALESIAVLEASRGRLAPAATAIEEAHATIRRVAPGPSTIGAYVANTRGIVQLRRSDALAARASFEEAMQMYAALNPAEHPMAAATQGNLGLAAMELEDYPAAATHYRRARDISRIVRPAGDERIASFACLMAAALQHARDPSVTAEIDAALAIFGSPRAALSLTHAECLALAALAALENGDAARAVLLADPVLAHGPRLGGDGTPVLVASVVRARVALAAGDKAAAMRVLAASTTASTIILTPRRAATAWSELAGLARQIGNEELARTATARAEALRL
ncbi:serine/threonine-protein kinase [Tahibacter amnicola]|uniref:Protein kinase n=1 Tax=Tahibacter amnicola TaxID=2976241 RepID=A0ABY6BJ58_9GAMM|nr:serine/threonine-protein kinase [Tahibacter amnicola]UXI68410.1 protein kinase [Tahibacter amnicola]